MIYDLSHISDKKIYQEAMVSGGGRWFYWLWNSELGKLKNLKIRTSPVLNNWKRGNARENNKPNYIYFN